MSNSTAAEASLARGVWDYSDSVYGLEPLTLPEPGAPWFFKDDTHEQTRAHLLAELLGERRPTIPPATAEDLESLFWFRWITGHQISFIVWQLLANRLAEGDRSRSSFAGCIRGYSAAMLYTGSCTTDIYSSLIRPSMYRTHRGFSGTWAADFAPVRGLLRRRQLPPVSPAEQERLLREVKISNQVHIGIASRLVPGGQSLLQEVASGAMGRQPRVWSELYDCYFITLRAPVPAQQVVTQLLRRCKAMAIDVATNGLYPAAARYPEEFPAELRSAPVQALEDELAEIMANIAGLAEACVVAQ